MSSQGAVPDGGDPSFGLIETLRWAPGEGYALLAEHLDRLEGSSAALGFACRREAVAAELQAHAGRLPAAARRVRLVLSRDGSATVTSTTLAEPPLPAYRVAVAAARNRSDDPWLRHKTTLRDRYERPLAAAVAAAGADEVLFLNERDELCEGARSNLFLRRDGRLLTPPLACGLLPGTLRAHFLATGAAREAVLRLDDLAASPWAMGNSVRGLVPASLIPRDRADTARP